MSEPTNSASASVHVSAAVLTPEGALLQRYVLDRDEGAFRALVESQIDFVYSAARRRLAGDAHSAADVTQQVFTALARQAPKLPSNVVLPAWLYTTARHLSANWVRTEQNRRAREQAAHRFHLMNVASEPDVDWEQLRPLLDNVIDELGEKDREAVLLRFSSRRSFAQIGAVLQLSEDAARMRVERALEKLRAGLAARGVMSSSAALGGVLTQYAVTAAPAGMSSTVAAAALPGLGALAGVVAFMTWTKFTLGLAAAGIVAAVGFALRHEAAPPARSAAEPVARTAPASDIANSAVAAPPTESIALQPASNTSDAIAKPEGMIYPQLALPDVLGPNNLYYDGVTGVSMTYPPGWVVRSAVRWGDRNRENTVMFTPHEAGSLKPSMYYNMYATGAPPPITTEEFLRTSAKKKEEQRIAAGLTDYKNEAESFVFRQVEGRPSLSYFATYTKSDELMAEYFMRIVGQKGYVMFFIQGKAEDVRKSIPTVHQMGATVRVP
jgi:RNA polymerase sigma factor (sigma-70 family)